MNLYAIYIIYIMCLADFHGINTTGVRGKQ